MKYSLTLHDLSAAQVTELANRFADTAITTDNVVALANLGEKQFAADRAADRAAAETLAKQTLEASRTTAGDVASLLNASTNQLLQSGKTGDVDSGGITWDERIHSGSKKKNADGKWKLRKNVDENLVKQVEAELLARGAAPAATNDLKDIPAFLQNQPPANPVAAPAVVPVTYVAPVTAPVAAPVAAPAAIMTQPLPPIARDFSGLMLKISNLFASKSITPDYPNTIVQRVNQGFGVAVATLTDIQHDPRMVEYSWQCLEVDGKAA